MARKLDTSNASATVVQPIKAATVDFIQSAYNKQLSDLCNLLLGFDTTDGIHNSFIYPLWGCKDTITGGTNHTITAGAVICNGEIFEFAGVNFLSCVGGNVPVWNLLNT